MSNFIDRSVRFYRAGSAFLNNAVQRRVNKEHYIQADKSSYEVICADGLMSVRHYKALPPGSGMIIDGKAYVARQRRYALPIVLVPPLGVFGWIFDLMADRSMVQYFLAHGFEVYLIDWGAPREDDKNISLEDYVCRWFPKAMAAIREHSGSEEQSLVGYCMGGLLALMYLASSQDDKVKNLVTIASPVDMHRMGFAGPLTKALSKPASRYVTSMRSIRSTGRKANRAKIIRLYSANVDANRTVALDHARRTPSNSRPATRRLGSPGTQ